MVRRAARIDQNHGDIVQALIKAGCSVMSMVAIGNGCPDLAVGIAGRNIFLEIKNPNVPRADRQLTPDQSKWHALWRGQVAVVTSPVEALQAAGLANDWLRG